MSRTKLADESIKLLRQRLDEIDGSTAEEIALHRERVEDLRSEYDHSIRYLDAGCARTDCVEYALNIPSDLINIAATFNSILEGFWLTLPKRLGEIPESEVSNGRVVLYFADGKMKHVGRIVQGTRVVSKWGKTQSTSTISAKCRQVTATSSSSLSNRPTITLLADLLTS